MTKCYVLIAIFINLLTACNNSFVKELNLSSYRADSSRYCKVHSLEYWKSTGRFDDIIKMDAYEKANMFSRAFRKSVKTPEMQAIIFGQGQHVKLREFYVFLQKNIPTLTQETFDCPAVAEFYSSQ